MGICPIQLGFYISDCTYSRTDLIWELHAELLGHLVRVEWVRRRVLLVEKVNLGTIRTDN